MQVHSLIVLALGAAFSGFGMGSGPFMLLADAFSLPTSGNNNNNSPIPTRRGFLSTSTASVVTAAVLAVASPAPGSGSRAMAATTPTIYNLSSGIKYAILKEPPNGKSSYPQPGDIVAIEYTGYLTTGAIFDGTHSEGKQNALLFKLGSTAVIPGINEMVAEMKVGQKVQAIVPPALAFGDKGICLDDGECLVKPGSTLVYDIYLKKASIPPP